MFPDFFLKVNDFWLGEKGFSRRGDREVKRALKFLRILFYD